MLGAAGAPEEPKELLGASEYLFILADGMVALADGMVALAAGIVALAAGLGLLAAAGTGELRPPVAPGAE